MLIIDNKKSIPLDVTRLDWNTDHVLQMNENVFAIPLHDPALKEIAEFFAYEVAAQYAWVWPDTERITVALQIDISRSYIRYGLLIGTKPNEQKDDECGEDWAEFEAERRKAIEENSGEAVYDVFPVMLSLTEDNAVRSGLYHKLGVY